MIVEAKPKTVIIFINSNGRLKTGTALQMKDAGVDF